MTGRFRELDGLRGIAAVLVVLSHLTVGYDSKYLGAPRSPIDVPWGAYGVQLFFLISGFVILMTAQRAKRPSDFVISRVSRLYPVYWVALTVSIVVSIVFSVPHTDVGWTARLLNYTMIQRLIMVPNVDEVYWTLAIEMQFYILILVVLVLTRCALSDRLVVRLCMAWCGLSLVLAIILGAYSRGIDPQLVVTPVKIALNLLIVEWGPFFATGMLGFLARRDIRYLPWAYGCGAAAALVSGILHDLVQGLVVAGIVFLFLVVARRPHTRPLLWRPVQFYGRISYSLYIGHLVTGMAIMHLLLPLTGRVMAMVLTFAAVTAYALLLHHVGEVILTRHARALMEQGRDMMDSRRRERREELPA